MVSQLVSYNQPVEKQLVKREEKSVLKKKCVSFGPIRVVKDFRALD